MPRDVAGATISTTTGNKEKWIVLTGMDIMPAVTTAGINGVTVIITGMPRAGITTGTDAVITMHLHHVRTSAQG